jgi:hypothetical protein
MNTQHAKAALIDLEDAPIIAPALPRQPELIAPVWL